MARLDRGYDSNYKFLTCLITRLIIKSLNEGDYEYLKNPQNRSASTDKARFRIMFRPPSLTERGRRELNLGYNEYLLFLHGRLMENGGLDLKVENSKYRWAIGDRFGNEDMLDFVHGSFSMFMKDRGRKLVENGEYLDFVKFTLNLVNQGIRIYDVQR